MADKPKTVNKGNAGDNIEFEHDGETLTLRIKLGVNLGPSASGKTVLIAKTGRSVAVANINGSPVFLGLNLYRYADR
jgi:hypothetical protein